MIFQNLAAGGRTRCPTLFLICCTDWRRCRTRLHYCNPSHVGISAQNLATTTE